jgi:HlyD family secretion protein
VARFQAALADARDNLDKTVYRAPVGGIVSRLNIEQGEIVITGTMNNPGTVILTLADLSAMEVEAEVDETDIVHVKTGQVAHITVDALPDTTFPGRVMSVGNSGRRVGAGTVEDATNFEVKVRFLEPDPRLRPGMTADIEVETDTHQDVLTVPLQALVARTRGKLDAERRAAAVGKEGEGADTSAAPADTLSEEARREREREVLEGVYKLVGEDAVFVEVAAGIADETRIEVTGDLEEGDRVVSGPYRVLRDLKEGTRIEEEAEKVDGTGS